MAEPYLHHDGDQLSQRPRRTSAMPMRRSRPTPLRASSAAAGRDVKLVTGTDEHGLKMIQTARGEGRETLEFADEMSGYFREMYEN